MFIISSPFSHLDEYSEASMLPNTAIVEKALEEFLNKVNSKREN